MMKIQIHAFFSLLWILANGLVYASENYADLSLQQAIEIALANNTEKKISLQAAAIAESQYQEALAARMPNISFQASFMRTDEDPSFTYPSNNIPITNLSAPLNAALGGLIPGLSIPSSIVVPQQEVKLMDRDTAIATLQATYPLYTGGKISSIINQANIAQDIAQQEYQRTSLQVIRDVKRYYYAVQLTNGLTTLAEDAVKTLETTRDLTKSLYQAGTGSVNKLDYLKTEVAVSYVKSLEEDFVSRQQSAVAALQHVMGIPMDSMISVSDKEFSVSMQQSSFDLLIKEAHQFNPQLGIMRLAIQIADEKIDEAKSAYYPQVALVGNVRHIENSFNGGLVNSTNRNSWTIGVVMSMPFYDFGRTSSHVDTARLESTMLREKQVLVEQGLAAQIKNLLINLQAANKQKSISETAIDFSKQHERLTARAYRIGAAKAEDVIQASILDAVIQGNYLRAKHDAAYQAAEVEYFVGAEVNKPFQ